jgi:5-methylcytosine-specific restriction protein A
VNEENIEICILCKREVPFLTGHHIVPKSRGGKELVAICGDCHRQLHALFDNKTLALKVNIVEIIMTDEKFSKYLKWIRKRPFGAVRKTKRNKDSKERGRRG